MQVTNQTIDYVMNKIRTKLEYAIHCHGNKSDVNYHESLGKITEEYHEVIEAIRRENGSEIEDELYDLIIACIWGNASRKQYELNDFNKIII